MQDDVKITVTIAGIFKNNWLALERRISASNVGMKDDANRKLILKVTIEIILRKSLKF